MERWRSSRTRSPNTGGIITIRKRDTQYSLGYPPGVVQADRLLIIAHQVRNVGDGDKPNDAYPVPGDRLSPAASWSFLFASIRPVSARPVHRRWQVGNGHSAISSPLGFSNSCVRATRSARGAFGNATSDAAFSGCKGCVGPFGIGGSLLQRVGLENRRTHGRKSRGFRVDASVISALAGTSLDTIARESTAQPCK
jgi:hypothetical protein